MCLRLLAVTTNGLQIFDFIPNQVSKDLIWAMHPALVRNSKKKKE